MQVNEDKKNFRQLNIRHNHINVKQHSQVTYFGCVLDERVSCEPVALKVINKINGKLKFLYRKNRYLTKELCRMLRTLLFSLILIMRVQPGTLISMKNEKKKIQIIQNKYIRFCLKLDKMHHISINLSINR